jgi:hypothetical protein
VGEAEQIGDRFRDAGADEPIVVPMAEAHLLQAIEIAHKRLPFGTMPALRDRSSRYFCMASARKKQNTWPRYRGVGRMKDRYWLGCLAGS